MKRTVFFSLLLCFHALGGAAEPQDPFNITDFGAIDDPEFVNTMAIQDAVEAAHAAGGGTVVVPEGSFVTGTILLKDNVTLHVSAGAQLLGSANPLDYRNIDAFVDATGQTRGKCLIGAVDAKNIGISGSGTIDGRGGNFQRPALLENLKTLGIAESRAKELGGDRPFLLRFVRSQRIHLNDVRLRQPAAWTVHFFQCDNILVRGLNIYAHAHRNNDAIDLDSSSNALIEDCVIDSGDDAICFKATSPMATHHVLVRHCTLKSDWGAIKFGTEAMGDFHDISLEKIRIHDTRGGGIKILSVDGANIRNINIRDIVMENVDMPIFIRLGERLRTYRDAPVQPVGSISDVNISRVTATTRSLDESRVNPPAGIFITGTPDHPIGMITLRDIEITLPGGGSASDAVREVEEAIDRYPEFSFFDVLPAHGLFARHVTSLMTANVTFKLTAPDARPERRHDR